MAALGIPTMPRTPIELFAGLTLISAPPTPISAVPSFNIVPPSPEFKEKGADASGEGEDDLFIPGGIPSDRGSVLTCSPLSPGASSGMSWTTSAPRDDASCLSPRSARSIGSPNIRARPIALSAANVEDEPQQEGRIRPLTQAEARQLTLVMRTSLGAVARVRGLASKETMQESITLAQKMHTAGLQWDKRRRVMGIHLRGTWEGLEGIQAGAWKNEVAVEYIKDSFVSCLPSPHPLDEFPLDLELPDTRPAAASPTLPTLQAGLARTMGVRPLPLILAGASGMDVNPTVHAASYAPQTGALTAIERSFVMAPLGAAVREGRKGGMDRLRGMKRSDLWVRTAAPTQSKQSKKSQSGGRKKLHVPPSAASVLTPTRMAGLMSASKKKKATMGTGMDIMASMKTLKLRNVRIRGRLTKMPKIPKVPGGVVRMGQLVVPKNGFGMWRGQAEGSDQPADRAGKDRMSYETLPGSGSAVPGSALPTARRVSVSGYELR